MGLLVVIHGVVPGMPLIVAATATNAVPARRSDDPPRWRRDELAILGGATEVAVPGWRRTEAGVVAGLDQSAAARWPDTASAPAGSSLSPSPGIARRRPRVDAFGTAHRSERVQPVLVWWRPHDVFLRRRDGTDPRSWSSTSDRVLHVLENRALHEPSPKSTGPGTARSASTVEPVVPLDSLAPCSPTIACTGEPPADAANPRLPLAARAICVHADEDDYGRVRPPHHRRHETVRTNHPLDRRSAVHDQWHASDHLWATPSTR